jgi:hypothetical protein
MKYIILPLIRLFVFLFAILIVYPIILVMLTLWGLWDFKWKEKYVNFLNSNFSEQDWLETYSSDTMCINQH